MIGPEWILVAGHPLPGVVRVMIYSEDLQAMPDELVIELPFRIASRVPEGVLPLEVANLMFAGPDGKALPVGPLSSGSIWVGIPEESPLEMVGWGFDGAGRFQFEVKGTASTLVIVERSDDLNKWTTVVELTLDPGGKASFVEEILVLDGARYFRAFVPR